MNTHQKNGHRPNKNHDQIYGHEQKAPNESKNSKQRNGVDEA